MTEHERFKTQLIQALLNDPEISGHHVETLKKEVPGYLDELKALSSYGSITHSLIIAMEMILKK